MLGASFAQPKAARRRLAVELEHEREIEARIEGELNAARSIQMGLLPHRFPGPPEQRDVDVYALIEPARMVGGDLYDFLLLDSRRLFFAIADVSGKGVPAALFMAMTKEVLRDAMAGMTKPSIGRSRKRTQDIRVERRHGRRRRRHDVRDGLRRNSRSRLGSAGLRERRARLTLPPAGGARGPWNSPAKEDRRSVRSTTFRTRSNAINLTPGDLLLLYTDGVTEAENPNDSFYTTTRLNFCSGRRQRPAPKRWSNSCAKIFDKFAAAAEQADDITMLAVHWTSPAPAPLNEP